MPAFRWEAIFSSFRSGLDYSLGSSRVLTVVTARVAAGVVSKNKLAVPEESWPHDKTHTLGYIPIWGTSEGCHLHLFFFKSTFRFYVCRLLNSTNQKSHTRVFRGQKWLFDCRIFFFSRTRSLEQAAFAFWNREKGGERERERGKGVRLGREKKREGIREGGEKTRRGRERSNERKGQRDREK